MAQRNAPDPESFRIPTIDELDAMRTELNLSQKELSRRAGLEDSRFNTILHRDMDPQTETMRSFLTVLQSTEPRPDDEIGRTGPKPEPSELAEPEDENASGDVGEFDQLAAKLNHTTRDAVGSDPRPADARNGSDSAPDRSGGE